MNSQQLNAERRRYRRCRALGTNNPFCRICGKFAWWIVYHEHHVGGRCFTDDLLFICFDCHKEVHEMEFEFDPLPAGISKERAALIRRLEGQIVVGAMQIAFNGETVRWLRGEDDLPPLTTANDNGAPTASGAPSDHGVASSDEGAGQ